MTILLNWITFWTLVILLTSSCSNRIDPKRADLEVRELLRNVPGFDWEPQENSRLGSITDFEFPPPPMDDNQSRQITVRIQREDAYQDGNNSLNLENASWISSLAVDSNNNVLLNLESSMELALRHSRDFQAQKEALYLSALDVTYERFQLDPAPFAGVSGQVNNLANEDPSDFESRLKAGFRGVSDSGTNWVASLANRMSIELSGGEVEVGGSLANLTLTQPLLRGASRRIYLEQLTQSERSLLADARSLEQFRRGFFLEVVLGTNPANRVGDSGIGPISPPSTNVSGFLGLVQDLQRIRNQEANVAKLNDSLSQLEAAFEAGRIGSRLQVDQARQALYNGQSRLLSARSFFENRLDGFKLFIGLPPSISMVVVDDYIENFRLTDPALVKLQDEVNFMLAKVRDPKISPDIDSLLSFYEESGEMRIKIEKSFDQLKRDFLSFQNAIPRRKLGFKKLRERSDLKELGMSDAMFADKALEILLEDLNATVNRLKLSLDTFLIDWEEWSNLDPSIPLDRARAQLTGLLNDFSGSLLELSLAQASARLESIVMDEIDISPERATQTASLNRMDWKNNRARLVDVWRKADLAKDDLRTDLDLVLSGNLGSDSMGSGHFESDNSSVSVGVELDTPLSKVRERNRYKASLLLYQQSRRSYLAFEDSIRRAFRQHKRLSDLFQLNFELNRAAVRGAIAQVDLARMRLDEPPQPGKNSQFGATTARDLVNALNDLLDASNGFLQVWIGYKALEMRYAYDLGTMNLSSEGIWLGIDQ